MGTSLVAIKDDIDAANDDGEYPEKGDIDETLATVVKPAETGRGGQPEEDERCEDDSGDDKHRFTNPAWFHDPSRCVVGGILTRSTVRRVSVLARQTATRVSMSSAE